MFKREGFYSWNKHKDFKLVTQHINRRGAFQRKGENWREEKECDCRLMVTGENVYIQEKESCVE